MNVRKIDDFKNDIKLAVKILNENTEYSYCRNLIDKVFKDNNHYDKKDVYIRLTVIDSLYSTNMSKRLFGISDLAEKIFAIGNDKKINEEIEKYKKDETSKIDDLLKGTYGIKKDGKEAGHARSLISKYLYFVTNHNFPIEDSLVKKNLHKVLKYYGLDENKKNEVLLKQIVKLCNDPSIRFDEFDNFMWLFGKINNGSLSLITDKDKCEKIIGTIDVEGKSSCKINEIIAKQLKDEEFIDEHFKDDDIKEFLMLSIKINNEEKIKKNKRKNV